MHAIVANTLGAAMIASVAGLAFAAYQMKDIGKPIPLDPANLCPIEAPAIAHVALMVDRTDALTPSQAEVLQQEVDRAAAGLPVGGRLSIHLISADPAAAAVPVLDRCNPGDGADIDPMWGNPRRARVRFDTGFVAPLAALLADLQTPVEAPHSPIIASLAAVATGLDREGGQRRIVLVSDLLENDVGFSAYRQRPDPGQAMATQAFATLREAGLKGITVELVVLQSERSGQRQSPELTNLWVTMIQSVGGTAVLSSER